MTASIIKFEIFDHTVASRLCKEDESIVTAEDKKAINRLRYKTKGNLLEVKYNYAKGYENLKVGRVYPAGSNSLGCLNGKIIRAPMTEKYYFDIDQVNAHYNIAYQYAKKRGLPHEQIKYYCENREECLEKAQEEYDIDRSDAKKLYLKIGYGGSLPDEIPDMKKLISVENVLPVLQIEMKVLADFVWENNPTWQDLYCKGRTLAKSGYNKKFKMLSLFLQTEERKILEAMDKGFTKMGRSVDILIHDGCMIRKKENEERFPRELMDNCEDFVKEMTGYTTKLEEKPIVVEWDLEEEEEEPEHTGFWKTHFLMNGKLYRENEHFDRPLLITNAKTYVMKFYKEFACDPDNAFKRVSSLPVREYDTFGFYPYGVDCPANVYNTFKGFKWTEYYDKPGLLSNEEYYQLIEEIKELPRNQIDDRNWNNSKTLWQIENLFCHHEDPEKKEYNIKYFVNILGNRLFAPTKPCEKVLCLRNEKGGSGKSGFLERSFADGLLGEEYFTSQSLAKHVFGEFNASISNKLFILCEESETKETKDFTANIKAAVTRKRNPIRLMKTDVYNEKNYCVYIANTNKQTAFEFDPENHRRFPQIDCKEYTLKDEEVKQLRREAEDPYYSKLLFEYILSKYEPDFDFNLHPDAESVKKLKEQFKDPFVQFFEILLYSWDDYYNEKYRDAAYKTYDLHKKSTWEIKAEQFCDLYKQVTGDLISKKFSESVKFPAFRQGKYLTELITKYPSYFKKKLVNYQKVTADEDVQFGTYYIIDLRGFREIYNPEYRAESSVAKKPRLEFSLSK